MGKYNRWKDKPPDQYLFEKTVESLANELAESNRLQRLKLANLRQEIHTEDMA